MTLPPLTLRRYEGYRGIDILGTLWTLHKGARTVTCVLTTHPLGWELTAKIAAELARSEVVKEDLRVLDLSEEWRRAWEGKGWTAE